MAVQTLLQIRRGAAATWTSTNSTLSSGEWGYETDTGKYKIGDGITSWNSLAYASVIPSAFIGASGIRVTSGTNGTNLTISVSGITSSQVNDFNSAVDARITSASISEEQVQDIIASGDHISTGFLRNGTGVYLDYDDNSNYLTINVSGYALSSHTHTLSQGATDVTATASEVNYLDLTTGPGTAEANKALVLDSNKSITSINSITTTGNLIVGGNLQVNGTTTTVNSTTVDIGDNIIQVNVSGAATQGGFQILNNNDSSVTKLVWDINDNRWEFEGGTANIYTTGNISASTFTSSVANGAPFTVSSTGLVTNLNSDRLDGEHGSYYLDWTNTTNKPDPIITGILTGDVTGSASVVLNDLTNGTLTINTTLGANTVGSGNIIDGSIINVDINANANIAVTKLAAGSSGQVLQVNSGGSIVWGSIDGGTP